MAFTLGVVTRRGPRGFWGPAHILILTSVMVPQVCSLCGDLRHCTLMTCILFCMWNTLQYNLQKLNTSRGCPGMRAKLLSVVCKPCWPRCPDMPSSSPPIPCLSGLLVLLTPARPFSTSGVLSGWSPCLESALSGLAKTASSVHYAFRETSKSEKLRSYYTVT